MHRITIYSKPGCHLCEEVKTAITRLVSSHATVMIEEINILKNPELRDKYKDDVERFRGKVDPDKLAQLFYDEFGEKLIGF